MSPAKITKQPAHAFEIGQAVQFTKDWLGRLTPAEHRRLDGRVGTVQAYRFGTKNPIVLFRKSGRFKELKLVDVTVSTLEPAPAAEKNSAFKPLSKIAKAALSSIRSKAVPRQELNPGVADRLMREALVCSVQRPSPYATHKGRSIEHFEITDAGRAVLDSQQV